MLAASRQEGAKPHRWRRHRGGLAAAVAVGACLAIAPSAGASEPAEEGVVLARLAGGADVASEVAGRTKLTLRATIPEIGWAVYAVDGDRAAAHRALLSDRAVTRIDFTRRGERLVPDYLPADDIFRTQGTVTDGVLTAPWNWHWVRTNFPAAWDITKGSSAVRVAIIDSEFDTEHPDLKTKLATGKNFDRGTTEYGTSNVRLTTVEDAHGTHVAGLVAAATDNGFGVSGACFDCVAIPYKITLGDSRNATNVDAEFIAQLTEALVEAGKSNAVAINMSLGVARDHAPLRDAVNYARAAGKVIVVAAGNDQVRQPGVLHYPAAYPGVIAVGATLPDDRIAPFSNNGDYVDVSAPGDLILSTWDSRLTAAYGTRNGSTHGTGYRSEGGTSMASPIVAGLVALMKTVRPDLNPDEVEALLKQSAVDLGAVGQDPVFGAGRIDALAAVKAAQAYQRPAPPPPPTPAPVPLRKVKFVWSCTGGGKSVSSGKRVYARVAVRTKLVCKGRTVPAVRSATMRVERFAAGRGWFKVGIVRTNSRGRFGFVRKLGKPGGWTLRPSFGGNATLAPSSGLGVKVKAIKSG